MNVEINLRKEDHGMYDDTFHLVIELRGLGKKEVRLSESDFYSLVNYFPMVHEIHPFPYQNNVKETAY